MSKQHSACASGTGTCSVPGLSRAGEHSGHGHALLAARRADDRQSSIGNGERGANPQDGALSLGQPGRPIAASDRREKGACKDRSARLSSDTLKRSTARCNTAPHRCSTASLPQFFHESFVLFSALLHTAPHCAYFASSTAVERPGGDDVRRPRRPQHHSASVLCSEGSCGRLSRAASDSDRPAPVGPASARDRPWSRLLLAQDSQTR